MHKLPSAFIFALLCTFLFFTPAAAFSQEEENKDKSNAVLRSEKDIWISIGGELSLYSYVGPAYGGSFTFGYGSGSSIGIKAAYFFNEEKIETLEICLLLRFYLFGRNAYSGPFLQFLGGPSLYNRSGSFSLPSNIGAVSAGLCFGWRFIFANRWFIEPMIRGGYPYLFGATVSAGVRF